MAGQGSARVTLREIDLSQVKNPQQLPQGVPAAVVGPARKGPAFVPRTFANMQQFNEVFGNMLEVGREGNSNQFGPLALNEWMKSAQAGTYIRVLGVGNGLAESGGKVADAGFVVGQKQLQEQSSGVAKVGDNPHATISDSTAALALGRTHMLGCFMKDATGSSYLKDAGMASTDAQASLSIDFGDQVPIDGSVITLLADNGDSTFTTRVYGFKDAGNVANVDVTISTAGGANSVAALLASEIQDNHTNLNAAAVAASGLLSITQVNSGSTGNTGVEATINHATTGEITIQGSSTITNSTSGATFQFREVQGLAKDVATITRTGIAQADDDTVTIQSKQVDGTDVEVVYTLDDNDGVAAAAGGAAADGGVGDAAIAAGFAYGAVGTCAVLRGTGDTNIQNNTTTLRNLKLAIDATDHNLTGLVTTSISELNDILTLTQTFAGSLGRSVTYVDVGGAGNAFTVSNFAGGAALDDLDSQVTLTFAGQPNVGDGIRFPVLNGSVSAETFHFIEEPSGDDAGGLNATEPGNLDDFIAGNTAIAVEIGKSLDITLDNFRNALLRASGSNLDKDHINVALDLPNKTIKVVADGAGGLVNNKELIFNMSSNVSVSNPADGSLTGNFGEKSTSFSGGQTNAAQPVVRGILMTPQGIRASLDTNGSIAGTLNSATASHIRTVAHGKTFGVTNTAAGSLAGYVVGEVSSPDTNQSFKLILNGYSNLQNNAVISCSFNPNSDSYFAKVLNTDPSKIEELGHYLYANWDIDSSVAFPSNVGLLRSGAQINGHYANMTGFLAAGAAGRNTSAAGKPDYEDFSNRFATAKTPWIVSQFYGAGEDDAARPATASDGQALNLFRLHALDDGEVSNGQFRLLISNLRYGGKNDFGSFDMTLESISLDPIKGVGLVTWKNASLDPSSRNFIGRLVGDKNIYYDFDRDLNKQRLREEGQYARKNSFVRIELSEALKQGQVPLDALPTGFQGHAHLFTKSNDNFVEVDLANANKIFTASGNVPTQTLSQAQVAPLDFVTSINRVVGASTLESDDDLAWGVKFAKRENASGDNKELVEQVFNHSIKSWSKFFPSIGGNPAWITDGDTADSNQNSFFSLEKIEIPTASLSSDDISTWDGANYKRLPSATPAGRFVKISKDALGRNARYLKFRCMFQGGFDGVNIFDEEKSEFTGIASLREGEDETSAQKFTGPTIMAYQRAIDVLSDKSATEFQLLAIPGQRTARITDYAINACEDRFDALLLLDIVEKDASGELIEEYSSKPHVRNTISLFSERTLDTSFAAAYFPDVVVRRPSDNAPIVVPPSVGMLGVMSRNDSIADPWFAPAGLSRGKLSAIDSRVQMNRALLDELYDADINPIYVPAGRSNEVYAFGQKTLLQDASALDRINVRRLLIDIRRKVRKVGEKLLFEPNRASTLSRFSSLVEPIMANVQQRRGVTRYKVQIDSSTTTQNDIENNTIRGKIYLQPTKSVEFISLDFVVANTIQQ